MTSGPIREAVRDGDYAKATELFAEYSRTLPIEESSLREVRELIEWVRATAQRDHAHAQMRLQELRDEAHMQAVYLR